MSEVEDAQERVREAIAAQQEARAKKAATQAAYDDALEEWMASENELAAARTELRLAWKEARK